MFIQPMLMQERAAPFDDERYIFEPLIDGHRLLLAMTGGRTRLLTRHGYDVTRQYPELHNVPLRKPADVMLDGEVAYINPLTGKAEYETLQQRFRMNGMPRIRQARRELPVVYFVFDIIRYNDIDLRSQPLTTRKRLLSSLLEDNDYFKQMKYIEREGRTMYNLAGAMGFEGVACKSKDSRYEAGKSGNWLKIAVRQ